MEQDKVLYSGFLLVPPQGKILIKKTWQQKYCLLYKASKFGIERLEIYENIEAAQSKHSPLRIITLENCIKITQKNDIVFLIITKTASYEFSATSEQSLAEWLTALQSVAFRDDTSKITSIEEDNDLYCSSGEGVFNVRLYSSSASKRCNLEPKMYTLILTSNAIQLRNSEDNKLLFTWPYCFIRRYGYRDGKFTFEAGRKCDSGEGTFHLEYPNQQEIFRCVSSKMKSMKKLLHGDSTPSILDCGDNQFHAALSMEARSRSPLPPSPTTSTSLHDIESPASSKSFPENSFEKLGIHNSITVSKPKPVKPPRKSLYPKTEKSDSGRILIPHEQIYEPVSKDKYDEIQYRSEAWRTLGTDYINHTESVTDSAEDLVEYVSWGRQKSDPVVNDQKIPQASKIITQVSISSPEDDSYDRLNFFGSSSKLNLAKSGYKQVSPAPIAAIPTPSSFNDYDEVQPSIESVRIADDSHLGYAKIRKSTKEPPVDHQFHNDEPYAVISKPKRV